MEKNTMVNEEQIANAIGDAIRRLRKNANLKRDEFAKLIGAPVEAIHAWESGTGHPTTISLFRMAAAVGIKASSLIEEVEAELFKRAH